MRISNKVAVEVQYSMVRRERMALTFFSMLARLPLQGGLSIRNKL